MLTLRGYRVVAAYDGAEALALLRDGLRPAVVVLDLAMPIMDGYAFREAQEADSAIAHIPVIVFSALRPSRLPTATAYVRKSDPEGLLDRLAEISPCVQALRPRRKLRRLQVEGVNFGASGLIGNQD